MGVFVVLLLVPLLMQHASLGRQPVFENEKNRSALLVFFLLLTVLLALRHESVGNDTANYIHYFKDFSTRSWSELKDVTLELGFACLGKAISLLTQNPQLYLAIVAILTVAMIYPTYRRLSTDSALTIALYCTMSTFVMMFSGIRQMLAIGIGFLAYEAMRRKRWYFFLPLVGIALTVHSSAFMLLFMYPIYHLPVRKKQMPYIASALLLFFIVKRPIFVVLLKILAKFTKYKVELVDTGAYTMLLLFIVFAIFAFVIPDESKLDAETKGLRSFLLFSALLQMFASMHETAMRMNYYYIMFIPLLLPRIIACRSRTWSQVARLARHVMVIFFVAYFFYSALTGTENLHVFPYHFFWEKIA